MLFQKTRGEFPGTTSELENRLCILEACMGNQIIQSGVFVEALRVLFLAEMVVVGSRLGCAQYRLLVTHSSGPSSNAQHKPSRPHSRLDAAVGHPLFSLCPDQQLGTDESQKDSNEYAERLLRQSVQKLLRNVGAREGDRYAEDERE